MSLTRSTKTANARLCLRFLWLSSWLSLWGFVLTSHSLLAANTVPGRGPHTEPAFARLDDGATVVEALDLNGRWEFKATDESEWQPAEVPGSVWTDLLRLGRIPDPFYRDNELKVQWVEKKEWEYRKSFQVDREFLNHDRIVLDCRGLDTIAEVYLNDSLVARTQNQFVEYEFDAKPLLREGTNQIHIIFRSIFEWDRRQVVSDPRVTWQGLKGRTFFTRKEASDFGWDWGVRVVTCGIWRPIRLAAYDVGRIVDLAVRQDLSDPEKALLKVKVGLERYRRGSLALGVQVSHNGELIDSEEAKVVGDVAEAELSIPEPKLWWPNGWGDQPLYAVSARLLSQGREVHAKHLRIGLRTVEFYREPDERGETFGIKVNGRLLFCKGVNWVPADALPERLTVSDYEHLLASCVEANMNMIRLWGGGLYEAPIFYDFCDEHGILIWHDFMFASGPYAANPSFLENVRQEIRSVVRRLRHHPSIALWCGNNEVESSMPQWLKEYPQLTWHDYDATFNGVIPEVLAEMDPDRPYWPGSPHHPLDRERKTRDWETSSGDAHIWDVWHHDRPFQWYVENTDFRFVSEFGFQSLPTMATLLAFTAPEDRYFPSIVLDHHNKCGKKPRQNEGNLRLARYAARMFKLPAGIENWVYVTQVMHAEGMRTACEAYRCCFPKVTGALYWQLDDNWPTISGSSIDYHGRWKALHYWVRHFFSPVLVTGLVEGTRVSIWAVNDRLEGLHATLRWTLARFDGGVVRSGEQEVTLRPNSSARVAELEFQAEVGENPGYITYRKDCYENRSHYYLAYSLLSSDGRELSSNVSFFLPPKYLALQDPQIEYHIENGGEGPRVTVEAKRFAAYVELGLTGSYARFSDNYFHLLPGKKKTVDVLEAEVPEPEFSKRFYVKSLVNSYQ